MHAFISLAVRGLAGSVATIWTGATELPAVANRVDGLELRRGGVGNGDADGNGIIDVRDYGYWPGCALGPEVAVSDPLCLPLDMDGDGDIDLADAGRLATSFTEPPCGDGVLDPGEQCDPPDGTFCGSDCRHIIVGSFDTDNCADAPSGGAVGVYTFDNLSATLDGPPHTACITAGEDQIGQDVWFCWTAPCTQTVFIQTCDLTSVDTKIAVYSECACPVSDVSLLSCNDDTCQEQTVVIFDALAGTSYLIRLGTYPLAPPGLGYVRVGCGTPSCPGTGDCFSENGTPGCKDETCCELTCAHDVYCCDVEWDSICAEEALGFCGDGFPACRPNAGPCTQAHDTPGCNDFACCNAVCQADSYCCLELWDEVCVGLEAATCFSSCVPGSGSCFTANGSAGCEDEACCAEVCPRDPFCCAIDWNAQCVALANLYCAP